MESVSFPCHDGDQNHSLTQRHTPAIPRLPTFDLEQEQPREECCEFQVRAVDDLKAGNSLKVVRVDVHPKRLFFVLERVRERDKVGREQTWANLLHHVIEVPFFTQHTSTPANNPVAIWYQPSTLSGTAFQDFKDVPDIVKRVFRFAYPHTESK